FPKERSREGKLSFGRREGQTEFQQGNGDADRIGLQRNRADNPTPSGPATRMRSADNTPSLQPSKTLPGARASRRIGTPSKWTPWYARPTSKPSTSIVPPSEVKTMLTVSPSPYQACMSASTAAGRRCRKSLTSVLILEMRLVERFQRAISHLISWASVPCMLSRTAMARSGAKFVASITQRRFTKRALQTGFADNFLKKTVCFGPLG